MVQESGDVAFYSVEMVARLAGVSPARVRRLEQAGLLQPAKRSGDQSFYGERELQRLRKIRRLTETLGVNLAGVAVILRLTDELAALREQLRAANTPGAEGEGP